MIKILDPPLAYNKLPRGHSPYKVVISFQKMLKKILQNFQVIQGVKDALVDVRAIVQL
jgi:hypothetical protein